MTREDDLAALKKDARAAKKAGKSAVSVPIDLLLALTTKGEG
jgi:hypothetical protein